VPMEGVRVPGEDMKAFRRVAAEGLAAVGIGTCTPRGDGRGLRLLPFPLQREITGSYP